MVRAVAAKTAMATRPPLLLSGPHLNIASEALGGEGWEDGFLLMRSGKAMPPPYSLSNDSLCSHCKKFTSANYVVLGWSFQARTVTSTTRVAYSEKRRVTRPHEN